MANEIGILLGQYAGSQSFESISSWDNQVTQSSLTLQTTDVHSSTFGAQLQVESGASGVLRYDYGFVDDLYDRWYSDVTTHSLVCYFWARIDTPANSGDVTCVFSSDSVPISFSNSLERYRIETSITSLSAPLLDFQASGTSTGSYNLYIDDIVIATDVITFKPEWDMQRQSNQNVAEHTTLQGRQATYKWGQFNQWDVHLSHINDLSSSLINQWWREARNLYLTLDTSDTNEMYIVRLANETNPFISVMRPYRTYSEARLNLQSIHYSLDY